jgi:hypothetical protein
MGYIIYISRLHVHYDDSQQYSHRLSTKKILRFFINCFGSLHNIFYERTGTIGSKSETTIPRPLVPRFYRAGGEGKSQTYMFVVGEGHDE